MGSWAMVAARPSSTVPVPVRGRRGATDAAPTPAAGGDSESRPVAAAGVVGLSMAAVEAEGMAAEPELERGVAAVASLAAMASTDEARDSRWRRAMSFMDTVRRSPAAVTPSFDGAAP
jgi:hypothetical protein